MSDGINWNALAAQEKVQEKSEREYEARYDIAMQRLRDAPWWTNHGWNYIDQEINGTDMLTKVMRIVFDAADAGNEKAEQILHEIAAYIASKDGAI